MIMTVDLTVRVRIQLEDGCHFNSLCTPKTIDWE